MNAESGTVGMPLKKIKSDTVGLVAGTVILLLACGCTGKDEPKRSGDTPPAPATAASQDESGYWDKVKEIYGNVKASGERVPDDVVQWTKEDFKKIGTWQYRILEVKSDAAEDIEKQLNELGAERWECFWIEQTAGGKRFFLKKAGKSYLQSASRMVNILPKPGGE
ncbi:MAG: hypothetical protein HY343_04970 [Lentisphaerae bacterium]|nr:hypothetical protein [Lentisphaerota bacterium]